MREEKHLQNLYRSLNVARKKGPVEQEVERYYTLLHLKLAPTKLKGISRFHVILLMGMIAMFFVGALLLPKPTESALEKRELAKKPEFTMQSLFDGSFTRSVETYFSDTFPVREWFVSLSAVVDESRGVRFDDIRIVAPTNEAPQALPPSSTPENHGNAPSNEPENSAAALPQEPDASSQPQESASSEDGPVNVSNGTVVYNGMAMSLFGGSPKSADWYADTINSYQTQLPDVQVYNMIIPTSVEFYIPEKYRELTGSQKAIIDQIYARLNSKVKKVDAYSALQAHKDEYLYFRTDHHWTGLGAYYAYTAFCEQAGFTPIRLEDSETRRLDNFIGTMYSGSQDSTLLKNPDYVDYYIFPQQYTAVRYDKGAPYTPVSHTLWGEYAKSPNSYSVFLHGDFPLIVAKTGIQNGRKIMVVKESFGNAFAPYLINHYEEVYIVDQRYFELSATDLIRQNGITELAFVNNSFAVCTPYHIQCIENLRYQSYQPAVKTQDEDTALAMAQNGEKLSPDSTSTSDSSETEKTASSKASSSKAEKPASSKASSSKAEKPASSKASSSKAEKPASSKASSSKAERPASSKASSSKAEKPASSKASSSKAEKPASSKASSSKAEKPASSKASSSAAEKPASATKELVKTASGEPRENPS